MIRKDTALIEVRAGTGGLEAKLWAEDLLRMYFRFAQKKSIKVSPVNDNTLKLSGPNIYSRLKGETGVHRIQRIPLSEKRGRIHTSTAIVVVMPEISQEEVKINPDEIEYQFFRASGKGGQNVQKVETAVRIIHRPTGIVVSSQQERYQEQNKQLALALLRAKLYQRKEKKRDKEISQFHSKAGSGKRSEKIRTYNFPQDRITDHRLGKTIRNAKKFLEGDIGQFIKR